MGFVFYDVETTGLSPAFDQITEFAAIRTDDVLTPIDRLEVRLRLMPHVLPSPDALCLTGTSIEDLLASERPSFVSGMSLIAQTLRKWSPSTIIGYNSTRFDERFLHHGFYQTLHPAYLTSRNQNSRGDALRLARAVHALRPEALKAGVGGNGDLSFGLGGVCVANGYVTGAHHEAMADTEALLWLCKLISEKAPDLWSQFLRFTSKRSAADFLKNEDAVLLFDPRRDDLGIRYVSWLGASEKDGNCHYCIDLTADIASLANMDDGALSAVLVSSGSSLRRVRINASPLMMPIYEVEGLENAPDEAFFTGQVATLRSQTGLTDRLLTIAKANETDYPSSPHVESQLYGQLIPFEEEDKMAAFHAASWEQRASFLNTFADRRLFQLGRRILFYERPDLLDSVLRQKMADGLALRMGGAGGTVPWMTFETATRAINAYVTRDPRTAEIIRSYRTYLDRLIQQSVAA
ncbi:exonuclease domain-containing protein [Mesorhizobium sp. L-8-3]|uniref:exonuclease domain-containing protein n=1 Tax=Mesorhizobium sp. L-8-3 TaxID=2744522 RepID=UPI0019259647|nr:exonuclease domain-containing protein [Mesorhizobium sp. L-8-3]